MKVRKGSITYWILLGLEKAAEEGLLRSISYSAQMEYIRNMPELSSFPRRSSLRDAIRRLRVGGLISHETNEDKEKMLKLTNLGKDYLGSGEEWDGKYRLIIWDIPEKKRVLRNLLRRKLKDWQFKPWQKSVWISKRNVTEKLRKLIRELGVEKWVVVIESEDPTISLIKLDDRPRKSDG